ncbi:Hypothetical protein SRAE_2000077800 [Strongyloides ratti]|uniref:Uncharacterized protein n=1 Tax=Strongyloides ratti TaxID=34506 RepID=A0A090LD88_STRRB|nr:Hypothetical protein SRAE_2000077800 [Strongyloides ratti]CEF66108.1 Hypothetical protein SRAE_2000077800 [Strongyloides ratti]
MILLRYNLLIIFLSNFCVIFSLYCFDGYGDINNIGIIRCSSQYCVSGVLEDGTKYHTCPSNSYCSWGSGCRRTKDAAEIFACCCSTNYCNSGNKNYPLIYLTFIVFFLLYFLT